jgi:hypothetical protein
VELVRLLRTPNDVGAVLFAGYGDFEVIVYKTAAPESIICYGILNKTTGVVESITNNFAKAKVLTEEFAKEAAEGYKFAPQGFPFGLLPGDEEPSSGGGRAN